MGDRVPNVAMPRIIIIEDHPVMREGLAAYFANARHWQVIGTAATLAEAKELLARYESHIDLILLDIEMPDGWGLDIIPHLQQPRPVIAVYTSFSDYTHVSAALGMGVKVYCTKQRTNQELETAMLQALSGKTWIDDTAQTRLEKNSSLIKVLSRREIEILGLVKSGLSNKQIAAQLGISNHTVENTIHSIYEKTGIHSRLELMKL